MLPVKEKKNRLHGYIEFLLVKIFIFTQISRQGAFGPLYFVKAHHI